MMTIGALGCLILAYGTPSPAVGIIGIMAIGLSFGAEVDIFAYVIARLRTLDKLILREAGPGNFWALRGGAASIMCDR